MMPDQSERAPLSFGQEQWWLLHQLQPDNAAHNIAFHVRLKGALDVAALERVVNELRRRHDILRTTIAIRDGGPTQIIAPYAPQPLEVVDLQSLPPVEREARALELAQANARGAFELSRDFLLRTQLLKLAPDDHIWLRTTHHATCDGWALRLLLREIAALYNAFVAGQESPLPAPALTHAEYARRQHAGEQSLQAQLAYWQEQLSGADPALNLPTDRPRPPVQTHRGAHLYLEIEPPLLAALKERSRQEGVTLYMTLLAAFSVWLHRHSGQSDLTIGSAIANRTSRDTRDLFGFVVNTLALRQNLAGDPPFREMLLRARDQMMGAFKNSEAPFRRLVQTLQPARDPSRSPLFQAFLVSVPYIGDHELTGLQRSPWAVSSNAALYDVLLQILDLAPERSDRLGLKFDYNADLFDVATMERMAARFIHLLEGVALNPAPRLSQLPLVPPAEREQILEINRGEAKTFTRAARVEELVAAQIERTPDAIALESESGETLTYRQLDERAGALANRLRAMGAKPGERVAICLERSLLMATATLGVLQSGAAYVPLDASYPLARLRATFDDAAPCALVTTRALAARFGASAEEVAATLPVVFADEMALSSLPSPPAPRPRSGRGEQSQLSRRFDHNDEVSDSTPLSQELGEGPGVRATDPAYLLYTSGSTGVPKGVEMPHRALINLLGWQKAQSREYSSPTPRTLQFAPLGFDVSFQEIFSTLSSGGTLILIAEETRRDPFALLETLIAKRVERLFLPFVALQQLAYAATRREQFPTALREVVSAGEPLLITPEIRHFFERQPHCVLHNHYGPTETHVVTSLTLEGNPKFWPERPTIGRPIANARLAIRDENGQLAPLGVSGELCIGGAPLATGYWKRPDLTGEKFRDDYGERWYRTGDLARWRGDGNLEFLGRRDTQIKVRGFRVELGEIETILLSHSLISQAVVFAEAVADDGQINNGQTNDEAAASSETRLVACATAKNAALQPADVRRFLREQLPDYMVPSEIVLVESLPLTPSGKLDRRALSALRAGRPTPDAYVAPQSTLEASLARAWSEVLNVPRVGRNDNFFELGGHSLLGTLVVSRLRDELHIELPLYHLFEAPTIEQLAARIETLENQSKETGFEDFDEGRL